MLSKQSVDAQDRQHKSERDRYKEHGKEQRMSCSRSEGVNPGE
jgi:hypothetical protein